jgi:flagellar protein FliO/FliZ
MNQASPLTRVAAMVAAVALLLAAPLPAFAAAATTGANVAGPAAPPGAAEEATPIDFTGASDQGAANVPGGGGSLVRTIVGLAIVIGVIYGVAWVLRTFKARKQPQATGTGLAALASVPLANGRSVHLVRAGTDLVLLGVAEQGVVPIRTYTHEEAQAAGLVDDDGMLILPADDEPTRGPRERRPLAGRLALPAALSPKALAEARREALAAKSASPAPTPPRPQLPAPRNALDTLRAWTVRG